MFRGLVGDVDLSNTVLLGHFSYSHNHALKLGMYEDRNTSFCILKIRRCRLQAGYWS